MISVLTRAIDSPVAKHFGDEVTSAEVKNRQRHKQTKHRLVSQSGLTSFESFAASCEPLVVLRIHLCCLFRSFYSVFLDYGLGQNEVGEYHDHAKHCDCQANEKNYLCKRQQARVN